MSGGLERPGDHVVLGYARDCVPKVGTHFSRAIHGQWGWRRESDVYGSLGLFLGPLSFWSTHPVTGLGHAKPRIHSVRLGKWQLTLEQRS